jgi:hypothetical protein
MIFRRSSSPERPDEEIYLLIRGISVFSAGFDGCSFERRFFSSGNLVTGIESINTCRSEVMMDSHVTWT